MILLAMTGLCVNFLELIGSDRFQYVQCPRDFSVGIDRPGGCTPGISNPVHTLIASVSDGGLHTMNVSQWA